MPLPTREALAALYKAAAAVVPVHSFGVVESRDDACVEILLAHSNGVSDHVILRSEMPAILRPLINDASQDATTWIGANPDGAVEWLLALGGVRRVVSFSVPNREPAARVWMGLTEPDSLPEDRLLALQKLVHSHVNALWPATEEEATEPLRRLEEAAHLLPALLHVLDVREVFDRLSV